MSKLTRNVKKQAEVKYVGDTPKQGEVIENITRYLNVYNYFYTKTEAKAWWLEYLKKQGDSNYNICKSIPEGKMITTVGWIAKMKLLGCTIPESSENFYAREQQNLINLAKTIKEEKKAVINTNEYVKYKLENIPIVAEIDNHIDNYINSYCKGDINLPSLFTTLNVNQTHMRYVESYYQPFLDELKLIPKDKEIRDSYSYLSKSEQNRLIKFIEGIIKETQKTLNNVKRQRKARVPKKPTNERLLRNLKYLTHSQELNISSIVPDKIIDCNTIWAYNTKTRTLFYLIAKDGQKLSVSGTTITNFDENKSFSKKVRKPEEVIHKIPQGGRKAVFKIFDGLTTKATPNKVGRINKDCLLLRAD